MRRTNWAWTVAMLSLLPLAVSAESVLRFETVDTAALTVTGNTLGLAKATGANGPGTQGSIGTFITTNTGLTDSAPFSDPAWTAGTTASWAQNRSEACLDVPAGNEILYAELIWGGSWWYGTENVSASLGSPVTLSFEDGGSLSVTPAAQTAWTLDQTASAGFAVRYYVRSADVTSFISQKGGGKYAVGAVPGTQSETINSLNAAGWTLIVAYQDPELPVSKLAIRVSCDFIEEGSDGTYAFDGFTTRASGEVNGAVFVSAIEGDAAQAGDSVYVEDGSALELSGPNNPAGNFFASQVNDEDGLLDTRGTRGTVNHDAAAGTNVAGARQGWDLTGVGLSSADSQLANGQQSLLFRASVSSGGDSFVHIVTGFQVEANLPPETPALVSPAHGSTLARPVALKWAGSADPNGEDVSYLLYLDTDPSFGPGIPVAAAAVRGGAILAGFGLGALLLRRRSGGGPSRRAAGLLFVALSLALALATCAMPSEGEPLEPDVEYLADGLEAGTTYYWKVEALDGQGGISESEVRSFTTQ